mgnify:CR=1 FL=1
MLKLKNNLAHTYKITFFGNTVELPDILGEDKLGSLLFNDGNYNIAYNSSNVGGRMGNVGSNQLVTPLITHTDRLYYN